jgi:hypothetical protein
MGVHEENEGEEIPSNEVPVFMDYETPGEKKNLSKRLSKGREPVSDPATLLELGEEWNSKEDENSLFTSFQEFKEKQELTKTGKVAYKDPNNISVPVFNIKSLPDYSAIAVIGASESGKSNWVAWALVQNNTLPWYNVFTETASNGFWQKYLPMKAVVQGFDLNRATNTLKHQESVIPLQDVRNVRMGCILDDLQGTKDWIKPVTALFTRGRHANIQTFALVQTKNGLYKHMRLNAKLVVIFRTLSHNERVDIAKEWMGDWHLTTATQLLSKYTTDHHGLIIDIRYSPPKLYKTKAPDMGTLAKDHGAPKPFDIHFPLGSKAFWKNDPRFMEGKNPRETALKGDYGEMLRNERPIAPGATLSQAGIDEEGLSSEEIEEKRAAAAEKAARIEPPPLQVRKGETPLFDF